MKKMTIYFAIVFFCFFATKSVAKSYSDKTPSVKQSLNADITIYVTQRCGYCILAKNFFKANSIPFFEIDINTSAKGR